MTPTTCIPQSQHLGTIVGSSIDIPLNADGTIATNPNTGQPYQFVDVRTSMNTTDSQNIANTCIISIDGQWQGDSGFTDGVSPPYAWEGGSTDKQGNPVGPSDSPSIPLNPVTGLPPSKIRPQLDTRGNTLNTSLSLNLR